MIDKLSIIIPCYNDHEYVEYAVNSALEQTFANKEIIVVDDGSDSQTKEVLAKLEPKLDLLISKENQGLAAARNTGIEKCEGDFILVWDADDYFERSFSEKSFELLKNKKDVKLVTSYTYRFDENGIQDTYKPLGGSLRNFLFGNSAMGSTMFIKKDWIEAGGYDDKMKNGYEDWEFYLRLLANGGRAAVIPEPLFYYRQKKSSLRHQANEIRYDLWEYIFIKNKELYIQNFDLYTRFLLGMLKNREEKTKGKKSIKSLQKLIKKIVNG